MLRKTDKRNAFFLLIVLFCFSTTPIQSQTDPDRKIPLREVIFSIEEQFPYQFTYADDTIEELFISRIPAVTSIDEVIDFLERETGLRFTILNDNFIAINKLKSKIVSICGYLKSFSTRLPLAGATIRGRANSKESDKNGFFKLEVSDENEPIIIGHLGYRTVKLTAKDLIGDHCLAISLFTKIESLPEIWLQDYLTKGISKNKDGSFQIDYSDFDLLPGLIESDVLQTIQALPGIQSADETVSNINIRGGTHDQNLILWDGIKMYQSGHFFGLISVFNPNITENVTLLKNGTASEFSDGVSGTILMDSGMQINQELKGSAGSNLINADVFLDVPVGKKSSFQLSARKGINDFLETPTYKSYSERVSQDTEVESSEEITTSDIQFDFYDTNVRWNVALSDNDRFRINFLNIDNELIFTESPALNSDLSDRQSSLQQNSLAGGLFYQRFWNNGLQTTLQVYETRYSLRARNANILENQLFTQENKVSETGIKLKTNYQLPSSLMISGGYQFIETGVTNLNDVDDPRFRENSVRVVRTHGVFSEISNKNEKLQNVIDVGLRYTYNEKFKRHFIEPRVSFNQKFLNYFNLEVLGELKHQNTSQVINFQNDFLGIEKRRWVLADEEEFPVVQSKQSSLGLQYQRKGWLISAEGYYKNIEGITARSQGFQNKYEFDKAIGSYEVYGGDFLINKRLKGITAWLSYTFADNTYTFEDFEDVVFPNNIDITHSFTFGSSYTMNDFKIAAGINWNSGLPTTLPDFEDPVNGDRVRYTRANSVTLQEYMRLDISATYKFTLYKDVIASLGAAVWNLTNSNNKIGSYYRLDENNEPQRFLNSALGFTPNLSFEVSF